MKNYLVEFKLIEETVYREWVEAESEEEAKELIEDGEVDLEEIYDICGSEYTDIKILETEEGEE